MTDNEQLRHRIAQAHGLSPSLSRRLVGDTAGDLEADARALVTDLGLPRRASVPSSDAQGRRGEVIGNHAPITSREQLKTMTPEETVEAYRSGRLDGILGH